MSLTYFLVDTSQTLLVLAARVPSTLGAQLLGWSVDAVFLCVYLPLEAAFIFLFRHWLRDYILTSLKAFRTQLRSLAIFAAVCYITLLLQVPTWEPWPALTIWTGGGAVGMILFVLMGYVLAFRTLRSLLAQEAVENSARQLSAQMVLSERYYQTLLERIEQLRVRDHDLRHHVNALSGLCSAGQWDDVSHYVEGMSRELPKSIRKSYCGNAALDALLGHYEELCTEKKIGFRTQVRLPELGRVEPLHLCVIFGNGLQNAVEASTRLCDGAEGFISVRAVVSDRRMVLSISNRFSGEMARDEGGEPISSKEEPGHGLGLLSIRETARLYGGWCGVTAEDGVFTLNVTLSLDS
ncbi:MAG: GHKL domain-containing protein [Oscillibacter sp.]|nr:GHKL domain-containing protein [Oscillibacter sp.]